MDEIRCDESSYLIWKWHPPGAEQGNNNRENAIRWGSSLRVRDGEVAVFVYRQKNGMMQDFIEGPFTQTLKTSNLPVLAGIASLAYAGGTPFQAEVYFINLARIIQVRFGVPFFDVFDPRYSDFSVSVAVRGTVSFQIGDYRKFIKLHRLDRFDLDDFQKQIRDAVSRYVKDVVTNAPAENDIPVIQLESRMSLINDRIEYDVGERLRETFGVSASGVDIGAIEIDKTGDGYGLLMEITQKVTSETIQAQTAANIKDIQDKQRIEAENYEETLRIQREEEQYARHKQSQSSNLAAFQVEEQSKVGMAGAEALGKMGANGAGTVSLSGGTGFNPAAMMAGMAVGGVVGQNLAGTMNRMLSGTDPQNITKGTPPPFPLASYHLAINGQARGPYDIETLKEMAAAGTFAGKSLVWKPGMENWAAAETVSELQFLFVAVPPVPPL